MRGRAIRRKHRHVTFVDVVKIVVYVFRCPREVGDFGAYGVYMKIMRRWEWKIRVGGLEMYSVWTITWSVQFISKDNIVFIFHSTFTFFKPELEAMKCLVNIVRKCQDVF